MAKWLAERQHGNILDVLLVVDPTEDLPGAAQEGQRPYWELSDVRFPVSSIFKDRISHDVCSHRDFHFVATHIVFNFFNNGLGL